MSLNLAVAGGGIGGLAAALACERAGCEVRVLEQGHAFSEVGAGIQLGPNVTRILDRWSLGDAIRRCAGEPDTLVVRDAAHGHELGRLEFGPAFTRRYGAPYFTIHRADLQQVLLAATRDAGVAPELDARVIGAGQQDDDVHVVLANGEIAQADVLIAADGVWTSLREHVVADGPAQPTGHFAFRALAPQTSLPAALRSSRVTLWLAPKMHAVSYPVRAGEELNVVVLVESALAPAQGWEAVGAESDLLPALQGACGELRRLVEAMPAWGLWALHDRPPLAGAHEMARGRIALLGDAAHPMLPYLAQGAGMAIEDADALASVFADATAANAPAALARYAHARWRRCAQVQARARRNATIFHAAGAMRAARDAAMRMLGERLLDQPWLYGR
ncbi:MAG TPA: FAD-dependent monooxygenase [Ramlibacter sp.]|jgi:salicylate hydroxylase